MYPCMIMRQIDYKTYPFKIRRQYGSKLIHHICGYDHRYMYTHGPDGGVFSRIDLESGEVEENSKIAIGGMPIQGNYFTTSSEQKYRPKDGEIITPLKLHDLILGAKYRDNSLHIFVENGSYPQKIEFAIDSDIAIGTKIKLQMGLQIY